MEVKLILKPDSTFEEAVQLLDDSGKGFVPVVDEENHLIGVITDGDIRRAILNKKSKLDEIINKNPTTVDHKLNRNEALQFLRKIRRRHLPVVDSNHKLVDVIYLDNYNFSSKTNYVVIMAGGLGSRLKELTKDIPKPMLKVGQKPILEHIVKNFTDYGFQKFIFCVNYKSHVIEDHFGDGNRFGIEITYNHEQKRMGTAGALSLIKQEMTEPFFVVNGDVLSTLDYEQFLAFHNDSGASATMCLTKFSHQLPYGEVQFDEDNNLMKIKEKPMVEQYINAGMYILGPQVLSYMEYNEYQDMPQLFERLQQAGKPVKVFKMNEYWRDIGHLEELNSVKMDMKELKSTK